MRHGPAVAALSMGVVIGGNCTTCTLLGGGACALLAVVLEVTSMTKGICVVIAFVCVCASSALSAHHGPASLGMVTLAQPVMAGGVTLQPGTYEVRLTGKHATPLPGQSEEAVQVIEFVQNGTVVATDAAEVVPADAAGVGTTGRSSARLRVERLRGDEFVRLSTSRNGERYLIHLKIAP
jgi:hypothetical protein